MCHKGREVSQIATAEDQYEKRIPEQDCRNPPIVRFRERGFLVSKKPAMAIRCVNNVHVAPFQRSSRQCKRNLRVGARFVDMSMRMIFARTGVYGKGCHGECKQ